MGGGVVEVLALVLTVVMALVLVGEVKVEMVDVRGVVVIVMFLGYCRLLFWYLSLPTPPLLPPS